MINSNKLLGQALENLRLFQQMDEIGLDYIVNADSGEMHYVHKHNFFGSHNLKSADLANFIRLFNVGIIPMHYFHNGADLPIFSMETGELIGNYTLNKCKHCKFPLLTP